MRRRKGKSFHADTAYFSSDLFPLSLIGMPPCTMNERELTEVVTWLKYIAAQGTTPPRHIQARVRAYIRGGSIPAVATEKLVNVPGAPTAVGKLINNPAFPSLNYS